MATYFEFLDVEQVSEHNQLKDGGVELLPVYSRTDTFMTKDQSQGCLPRCCYQHLIQNSVYGKGHRIPIQDISFGFFIAPFVVPNILKGPIQGWWGFSL